MTAVSINIQIIISLTYEIYKCFTDRSHTSAIQMYGVQATDTTLLNPHCPKVSVPLRGTLGEDSTVAHPLPTIHQLPDCLLPTSACLVSW
jgi:hypothetical protein